MKIIFDFEENDVSEVIERMYSGETDVILNNIKELIERRLTVLKEDIEWQDGYVKICITTTKNLEIVFVHVTDDLKQKMESLITRKVYDHIVFLISPIWGNIHPEAN